MPIESFAQTPRFALQNAEKGCVWMVDDEPDILQAFHLLLSLEGYVCHAYTSAADLLQALAQDASWAGQAACVLCDVKMPGLDGLQLQTMLAEHPSLSVVLMSGASGAQEAVQGFRKGAVDFLIKPVEAEHLLAAIDKALDTSRNRVQQHCKALGVQGKLALLSQREHEVARLVARGLTNAGIALALNIAERTVKFHRKNVFDKLGIVGTPDLVRLLDAQQE